MTLGMDERFGQKRRIRALKVACVAVHVVGLLALAGTSRADTVDPAAGIVEPVPTTTAAPVSSPRPEDPPAVAPEAPTTTETVPAPPPTPEPAPSEPPAPEPPAPAPAPPAPVPVVAAPSPPPPPPAQSLQDTVDHSYRSSVPQRWRSAVPARLEVVNGTTSWAWSDGRILIAQSHARSGAGHLAVIITHEFGHLIAFAHGSGAYDGAPPAGWPPATSNPAEHWADCVQQVFTGTIAPSHDLPPCAGEQLSWAHRFLSNGPPA